MMFLRVAVCLFFISYAQTINVLDIKTSGELFEHLAGLSVRCLYKTQAPPSAINIFTTPGMPEDDETICYLDCLFKEFEVFTENSEIDNGKFKAFCDFWFQLPENKLRMNEIYETCKEVSVEPSKKCGRAYNVLKCYGEYVTKYNLPVNELTDKLLFDE